MRSQLALMAAAVLAACTTQVPDSGAGVGFEDYNSYVKNRTAAPAPAPVASPVFTPDGAAAAIDRATAPAAPAATAPVTSIDNRNQPRGNAPAGIQETTSEMDAVAPAAMSDEQDFNAVSARESIESDAQRIARNRAQYHVDQPTALPERTGDTGPNIVQFALSTSHPPGTQMYNRSGLSLSSADRNCARYTSPDLAQEAFLDAGGPEKDRKGLDPDGDGYACGWDPRPFRTALQ